MSVRLKVFEKGNKKPIDILSFGKLRLPFLENPPWGKTTFSYRILKEFLNQIDKLDLNHKQLVDVPLTEEEFITLVFDEKKEVAKPKVSAKNVHFNNVRAMVAEDNSINQK